MLRLFVGLRGGGGAWGRPVGIGALESSIAARPRPPGVHVVVLVVHAEWRQRERRETRRLSGSHPPLTPGPLSPGTPPSEPVSPPAEPPVAVPSR